MNSFPHDMKFCVEDYWRMNLISTNYVICQEFISKEYIFRYEALCIRETVRGFYRLQEGSSKSWRYRRKLSNQVRQKNKPLRKLSKLNTSGRYQTKEMAKITKLEEQPKPESFMPPVA